MVLMRAGILFGEVVVVVLGVLVVEAVKVMSFFEKRSLSLTEKDFECLGVSFGLMGGDIFNLGGGVWCSGGGYLELVVGVVFRLVWGCLNGRLYILWRLS